MKKREFDLRNILSWPAAYGFFSNIIAPGKTYPIITKEYIRPKEGDKVLDIGSGISRISDFLPSVEYFGLDMNQRYVEAAIKRYGDKGIFIYGKIDSDLPVRYSYYDIVLALGVLHHLDDAEASRLFAAAKRILRPGGRLVTLDGFYSDGQSKLVHYFLSADRGKYIRTREAYLAIATRFFTRIQEHVRRDLSVMPYDHIIMECTA